MSFDPEPKYVARPPVLNRSYCPSRAKHWKLVEVVQCDRIEGHNGHHRGRDSEGRKQFWK